MNVLDWNDRERGRYDVVQLPGNGATVDAGATVTGTEEEDNFVPFQHLIPNKNLEAGSFPLANEDDEKMSANTSEKDSGCCSEAEEEITDEEESAKKI